MLGGVEGNSVNDKDAEIKIYPKVSKAFSNEIIYILVFS
jgi:hypothetical protein